MPLEKYKQEFIDFLLKSKALKFGDFMLKSGRKCPYFLNMGQFYTGEQMTSLSSYYAAAMQKNVANGDLEDFEIIFGPAYKGIPLCVAITLAFSQNYQINKSFTFNRKEAKDHGEGGLLVGAPITAESKLVIVDDVMTAGTALRETLELLKKSGNPKIAGVMIAVDRMEKGQGEKSAVQELKDNFGVQVSSIVTIEEIISYLTDYELEGQVLIDETKMEAIRNYRREYGVK